MIDYLQSYLDRIIENGNIELAQSVEKTANDIGDQYIKNFSYTRHEIGLLLGNVQSGKTGQMFGVICRAADLGFSIFLLLTTDNNTLQKQTLDRVKADLKDFCVCDENNIGEFIENNLMKPTIIVLKKNARVLKLWANIIHSTGFVKGNPLFIIDDEGDAASLNTLVNKGQISTVNKYIESIRAAAASTIYLQVTGTPQALLLQSLSSGWHPYFIYYFKPGKGYLGGDFFFPITDKQPSHISYIDDLADPILEMIIRHIAVSAQVLGSGEKVSNLLIHPSVRQAIHDEFAQEVSEKLKYCCSNWEYIIEKKILKEFDNLTPDKHDLIDKTSYLKLAKELLFYDKVKILILNGKNDVDLKAYLVGCNIIIGGNTLGRGVTFPGLNTIYYSRISKNSQADTMWQHSRMFGYDRDPGLIRIYIDKQLFKLFSDINSTNNSIIAQVKKGYKHIKVYYPSNIKPTRLNVMDKYHVDKLNGGVNYYPSNPYNVSIEKISEILEKFDDTEMSYQVALHFILHLFDYIIPSRDFKQKLILGVLKSILAENPTTQGVLIVRRNREITQGTGALLSPNDLALGRSFSDKVVLTMYQVRGTGWLADGLWVPNIKLPDNIVYYDIKEL